MTLPEVMQYLEKHGDEKVRLRHVRNGAGNNVFGVLLGLECTLNPFMVNPVYAEVADNRRIVDDAQRQDLFANDDSEDDEPWRRRQE